MAPGQALSHEPSHDPQRGRRHAIRPASVLRAGRPPEQQEEERRGHEDGTGIKERLPYHATVFASASEPADPPTQFVGVCMGDLLQAPVTAAREEGCRRSRPRVTIAIVAQRREVGADRR